MTALILGLLLGSVNVEGTTYLGLATPPVGYETIEECIEDSKLINTDPAIPYVLVCTYNPNYDGKEA